MSRMNAGTTDTAIKEPEKTLDEQRGDQMNETENKIYEAICRHDGIKAKDIAKETGVRVPKALKDLDKKESRHRGVIEIKDMAQAVEDSVK